MTYISFRANTPSPERTMRGKSLLSLPDDYVVIDLETTGLDPQWDAIIEIAALKICDNEIADKYQTLVNPRFEIDEFITDLTGITNEMLASAPLLDQVLPDFIGFIGESLVVGHNVNFDINFIYDNCKSLLNLDFTNDFVDTMRLSRRLFPEERHHRLIDLIKRFGVGEAVSHRGMSDVLQTFGCYCYIKNYVAENNASAVLSRKNGAHGVRSKDIIAHTDNFDTSSQIYSKTFVFTGVLDKMARREAMQRVVDSGGKCGDRVTQSTNFLVLGCNDYCKAIKDGKSTKQKRAEELALKGYDIEIISESVFYEMLNPVDD